MPIIKSIGRKDCNFRQLIHYLHQQDGGQQEGFTYLHNINSAAPDDLTGIEQAFKNNNQYRKNRKNGIGQYHEVMSFDPEDTQVLKQHPEILEDLARVYLELRAPDAVAIARPHSDKRHLHLHFMISPNEFGSNKAIRLSKKQFQALRRTIEEYQLQHYPELSRSYVHSRDREKYQGKDVTRTHKEWQMHQRTDKPQDKHQLVSTVSDVLARANDEGEFQQLLLEKGLEPYRYRGKLQGVVFKGRKYRFGRLLGKSRQLLQVKNQNERNNKKLNVFLSK